MAEQYDTGKFYDPRIQYYLDAGYTYDKAKRYADSERDAAAAQAVQADTANKSFVESLTASLRGLIGETSGAIAETSQKQVQAVIDAAAGNTFLDTANAAFRTPDTTQPGGTVTAKPSAAPWVLIAIAIIGWLVFFRRK